MGPLDWAEVDSSQGDVPRCHAFKPVPPQKAGEDRPAGEALGKDLGWYSGSPCQRIATVSLAARHTNVGHKKESLLTWGGIPD